MGSGQIIGIGEWRSGAGAGVGDNTGSIVYASALDTGMVLVAEGAKSQGGIAPLVALAQCPYYKATPQIFSFPISREGMTFTCRVA